MHCILPNTEVVIMEAQVRHQQYILFYSGILVLIFDIWYALKIIISYSLHPTDWSLEVEQTLFARDFPDLVNIYGNLVVGFALLIGILFRIYLCLSAMQEAAGKKKTFIYLIFAFIVFCVNVVMGTSTAVRLLNGTLDPSELILPEQSATIVFIEVTANIALFLLISSGVRIRILRKKLEKQKPEVNFGE